MIQTHSHTNSHVLATQAAPQRLAARDRLARGVQDARVFRPRRSVVHPGTRIVLARRDRRGPSAPLRAGGRHCGPGRPQGLVSAATATLQRRSVRCGCWPFTPCSFSPSPLSHTAIVLVPTTDDMLMAVGVDSFSFPSGHTSRCVMLAALAAELSVPPVCSSVEAVVAPRFCPALQFTSRLSGVSAYLPFPCVCPPRPLGVHGGCMAVGHLCQPVARHARSPSCLGRYGRRGRGFGRGIYARWLGSGLNVTRPA